MSSWQNFVKAKALKTDTVGKERGEPMNYFDKNGNQIKAGMDIRMADGSFERVYETTDAYGNQNMKTMADQIADYATVQGTTDVGSFINDLRDKTGIDFS